MPNAVRITNLDGEKLQWIDRAQTILDVLTRAGTMYLGYNAFEKLSPGAGLSGAIVSQIAMKLASSQSEVSGAVGCGVLAMLGLTNIVPTSFDQYRALDVHTWAKDLITSEPIDVHALK